MRLIDASELVQVLCVNMDSGEQFDKATHCVDVMPTVDAVPVIRCKDCKWFDMSDPSGTVEPIGYGCKKVTRLWREPDDYCKGAERKEENE